MYQPRRRSLATVACSFVAVIGVAASCSNAPPPPLVEPPPAPPTSSSPARPMPIEVVVGVDEMAGGFNPHTLADLSPSSSMLASLMLPSAFRPGPDGRPQLDGTLLESAEVVPNQEKFTVRYTIRKEASWSDGAPIAAEDFVYLYEQLRSQPGVSDGAGYQLIEDVSAHRAGKAVEVTFAKPYPAWRTLFSNLLPAHLLKDAPRPWAEVLDGGYPASGGPFAIRQVDKQRGEIILERNERYWGPPAASDRIVLRADDQGRQIDALRSGDSHLAVLSADGDTMDELRELGDSVRLTTLPRPATMEMLLRPVSPWLRETRVRAAVASALDREKLIEVGADGGPSDQLPAHAQVLAPSEPGYVPTEPAGARSKHADPHRAHQLLTEAGFERRGGVWTRGGKQLNLVIAAPFERERSVDIANEAAAQLRAQGIGATVITPTGDDLYGEMLSGNPRADDPSASAVDMAVAPRPAGGDPATMLASSYGCPAVDPSSEQSFPFNIAGFCDELTQPTIDAALSGKVPFADASARIESMLWDQSIALPLYQQTQVMAVRKDVSGVSRGNGFAGPFSTAAHWLGTPASSDGY